MESHFLYDTTTLQFLGFINTPNIPQYIYLSEYSSYETKGARISGNTNLDLQIPEKLILGKRVEHFFEYYVENFTTDRILARNLVISLNQRTIGEIDFLIQNKENLQITHVELIYKYYLYDPGFPDELDRWIGPNRRDTLKRKLDRLQEHQFPLLFRKEAQDFVAPFSTSQESIQQKVCFKTNLFVPRETFRLKSAEEWHQKGIRGYWMHEKEFNQPEFLSSRFYSPRKSEWLIDPQYCIRWYSHCEIRELMAPLLLEGRSPLLWMKKENGEIDLFFLVPWED